jgi:hypothetical protein
MTLRPAALPRATLALWVALAVICAVRAALQPASHTVYPVYTHAARAWLARDELYVLVPGYDYYRYSPLAAAFFAPWLALGDGWGGAMWRIVGAALLAQGLFAWTRLGQRRGVSPPLVFLLVWPFLLQNVNNGQSNPHMLGLLLLGTAEATLGRLGRSATWFAMAALLKPYTLAAAFLVAVAEPRLWGRLMMALAVGLALPFCFGPMDYVASQYVSWVTHLTGNDRSDFDLKGAYRDLALLFRVYLVPLRPATYHAIQLAAALAMAAVTAAGRRMGFPRRDLLTCAFALAACWMTVLGPATESCTYLLLAPSLAATLVARPSRWLWLAYGLFAGTIAAGLFPQDWRVQALGPQPLAGLILLGVTIGDYGAALRRTPAATAPAALAAA